METIRYWLDFYTVPVLLLAVSKYTYLDRWEAFDALFAGYMLWVFFEYFMHRVIFHRWFRAEHWVHHRDPAGNTAHVPQWVTHGLLFGALGASLALLGERYGCPFTLGLLAGYYTYQLAHQGMHHGWITASSFGPIGRMVARHELHHQRGFERNFNVACPIGDVLFGTYTRVERRSRAD